MTWSDWDEPEEMWFEEPQKPQPSEDEKKVDDDQPIWTVND